MAAANYEEYEKWITSLQLITERFGFNAVANGTTPRPTRGASVPCFSSNGVANGNRRSGGDLAGLATDHSAQDA